MKIKITQIVVILFIVSMISLFNFHNTKAYGPDDFVITIQTNAPGASGTNFTIPTYSGETYNYNVDCDDDGTYEATGVTGDYTCTYASDGTYTVVISDNTGTNTGFPRIYFYESGEYVPTSNQSKLIGINQWGSNKWTSMNSAFYQCQDLNDGGGWASDAPDLSSVTDMSYMFHYTSSFNQDIGSWNISSLTNASYMFYGVSLSTSNYDSLLNGWGSQIAQNKVVFDGGNSKYCNGETGRDTLINTYNWTITDGGNACDSSQSSNLYRFWSDEYHHHFYTSSEYEKEYIINNYPENVWKYEGVSWNAPID